MSSTRSKLIDHYLNNALFADFMLVVAIWVCNTYFSWFDFSIAAKDKNLEIVGDTVAGSISLAGFILASLTVIASIRSNITNRPPDGAKNPLELFFSDANYSKIVQVFKDAIIELIVIFLVCYAFWISQENISNFSIFKLLVCAISVTTLSVFRTLLVLFTIIKIDK